MKQNNTAEKRSFSHLNREERFTIEKLYLKGVSIRTIAEFLGRSPNTVSRELRVHRVCGQYQYKKAHHKAYWFRWKSKRTCLKVSLDPFLDRFVREKLMHKWSPRQISGYLHRELGIGVSAKAIYRYAQSRSLEHCLFWGWNKQKTGPKVSKSIQNKDNRKYIEERPALLGVGHYEMDFVVSKQSKWVLLVIVDRVTKYTVIRKIRNRKRSTVMRALSEVFRGLPVQSITTDNDIAFSGWRELEQSIQAPIYFCHPYHSWEKGLVENTNRWIRCFVKKKQDIWLVTEKDLKSIHSFLNDRPRACIDYQTPSKYYLGLVS